MGKNSGNKPSERNEGERVEQSAGAFSAWLQLTRRSQKLKVLGADVPCGSCTACCRASYFIHIKPEETQALKRIPRALLFPAPGLPKGHFLMGYNKKGECPMLIEGKCSIYDARPQTCRDFDCRVFTATGISLGEGAQAEITEAARRWRFEYPGDVDRREQSAVRSAAAFLQEQGALFAPGVLPGNPVQLAVLAVLVYDVFDEMDRAATAGEHRPTDAEIAKAVTAAIDDLRAASRSKSSAPTRQGGGASAGASKPPQERRKPDGPSRPRRRAP